VVGDERTRIRVLIVAAESGLPAVADGALTRHPALAVTTAASLDAALAVVRTEAFEVAVVDHSVTELDPITVARLLRTVRGDLAVLLHLPELPDGEFLGAAVDVGCAGIVLAAFNDDAEAFVDAATLAARGEQVFPVEARRLLNDELRASAAHTSYSLTRREVQILQLLARGMTTAAMAEELGVTTTTVRNYVQNLLGKMNAHSRLEAVLTGLRDGIVSH
jgi:DNA-binding NarL/FixJ family response regulator